jgi:signal transduction histidine kinase
VLALELSTLAFLAAFAFGVVGGGVWLGHSSFDAGCQRRVAGWCLGGLVGSTLVLAVLLGNELLVAGGGSPRFLAQDAVVAVSGGTFAGLLLGVYDADLRRHSQEVTAQRNALATANELLRHHVLNGMQVVLGYTDVVREESTDVDPAHMATVEERGREVVELVQRMGYLMRSLAEETDLYTVELDGVVESAVAAARETNPEADISLDVHESPRVRADDLLGEVVTNLLDNAVTHSDREHPRVDGTVERAGGRGVVRVADDGPGVPDERREAVFEPDESTADVGRGLGLYLVRTLVDRYGGSVHVTDNEPRGAVFTVELPLAAD